jgi:hypothetical protein
MVLSSLRWAASNTEGGELLQGALKECFHRATGAVAFWSLLPKPKKTLEESDTVAWLYILFRALSGAGFSTGKKIKTSVHDEIMEHVWSVAPAVPMLQRKIEEEQRRGPLCLRNWQKQMRRYAIARGKEFSRRLHRARKIQEHLTSELEKLFG